MGSSEEDKEDDGYEGVLAMLNFIIEYDQAGGGQEKCLASKASGTVQQRNDVDKPVREGQTRFGTVQFPLATLSRVTTPPNTQYTQEQRSDNLKVKCFLQYQDKTRPLKICALSTPLKAGEY